MIKSKEHYVLFVLIVGCVILAAVVTLKKELAVITIVTTLPWFINV